MDEDPSKIEESIRSTRRQLGSNLQELEHRVKDATNWRVQFGRHPWAFIGAAFTGGVLLSVALSGRRSTSWSQSAAQAMPIGASRHVSSTTSEIWSDIKSGLVAAAGSQLRNVLNELIPGFSDHRRSYASAADAARRTQSAQASNGEHNRAAAEPPGLM